MKETDYQKFLNYLEIEDKDGALQFVIEMLASPEADLVDIYQNLLARSLHEFTCELEEKEICVWKEHARTSIIRTILEATYLEVVKRKPASLQKKQKVIVVCPAEEFHEIGAIMITNYFSMVGFNAMYIGANTPSQDIVNAAKALQPNFLALSVTDYYNLVVTKKIAEKIRAAFPEIKIIVGGQAFMQQGALEQVVHDYYIRDFEEIQALAKAVLQ